MGDILGFLAELLDDYLGLGEGLAVSLDELLIDV